ncbi:M20 family metallo-hydrolase [Spirosoma utsteinense]|uniref:Acetylornithine deacetylase n=1 Tax=Spirosoma utsteinense TaxID=2585773 RepID=A0ABR6W5N8_9BACT|nr:M20 family metallo-hydrolase [Spirosoma utsteinense]MBC3786409.1 acetylornithine deacetylase [Spirosoma utsteinense]MBC3791458.1 acetylornithine deacetylase [Spirosoma utsteinense]
MSQSTALADNALALLKRLIATPSFSREEDQTAALIEAFFQQNQIPFDRLQHNVWAKNRHFDPAKPTLLLNSHHDTVRPNTSYTLDPFEPIERDGKLFGLGSNDAGGCLVALLATFVHFYDRPGMTHNIIMAATAEEEISGRNGLELLLPELPPLSFAIVGEPTEMQLAIAEKGLLVLDCTAHGVSGHAARDEGENAIYNAIRDIDWLTGYQFPKVSPTLGPIKLSVTMIQAGTQHNVVPDSCTFTIDARVTEQYTLEEVIETIRANVRADVKPRSIRLKPSSIPADHPIVQAGIALGRHTYGSPTTSDQAVLNCPSLKCGPGHSGRSHSADEFIYLREIGDGIDGYIQMLDQVL